MQIYAKKNVFYPQFTFFNRNFSQIHRNITIIRKYPDIHNYLSLDKEVGIRLPTSPKNILPSISFPSIPSFKYFSYNPPSSSAYNKDHRPWHNHDLILKATPKNGGCGSSAFPACGTTQQRTTFPNIFQP